MEILAGYNPRPGCAEICGGTPCDPSCWSRRWSSLWGAIRVRGVPKWAWGRLAKLLSGAVGGAPFGPQSISGVCRYGWNCCELCLWVELMRTLSLGLPVELPVGHDPFEGSVELCREALCESSQWCRTWNSQWCTFRVKGVAAWAEGRHANFDSGTVSGPPRGARSV